MNNWAINLANDHGLIASGWLFNPLPSPSDDYIRFEALRHKQSYGVVRLYDPGDEFGRIKGRVERLVGGGCVPGIFDWSGPLVDFLQSRSSMATAGGAVTRLKGFSF